LIYLDHLFIYDGGFSHLESLENKKKNQKKQKNKNIAYYIIMNNLFVLDVNYFHTQFFHAHTHIYILIH
jgi:hypothetical protein